MHHPHRFLVFLVGTFFVPVLSGCPGSEAPEDAGTPARVDLRRLPDMRVDLAVQEDLATEPESKVGAPCVSDADCSGTKAVCWARSLFNLPDFLTTPDGYCSASCTKDADCGGGNLCLDFGAPIGRSCIKGCMDATTCRHPGYSCMFLEVRGGKLRAGCFPNEILTCNPKVKMPCTSFNGVPGSCIRQAFEDERGGLCYDLCEVGAACDIGPFGEDTTCLFIDVTASGDAFRGTTCFPKAPTMIKDGDPCALPNECQEGSQCDTQGSLTCRKLCHQSRMTPRCPAGTLCKDSFGTGSGAGLCY